MGDRGPLRMIAPYFTATTRVITRRGGRIHREQVKYFSCTCNTGTLLLFILLMRSPYTKYTCRTWKIMEGFLSIGKRIWHKNIQTIWINYNKFLWTMVLYQVFMIISWYPCKREGCWESLGYYRSSRCPCHLVKHIPCKMKKKNIWIFFIGKVILLYVSTYWIGRKIKNWTVLSLSLFHDNTCVQKKHK